MSIDHFITKRLILNLSDTISLWFRFSLIPKTYLIPDLSDIESVWFGTIWIQTYLIPNLPEPIWFRTYLIPNLSDSDPIWFWTSLILNQSETEQYQTQGLCPPVSPSPFNPETTTNPSQSIMWLNWGQNRCTPVPPPPSSRWLWTGVLCGKIRDQTGEPSLLSPSRHHKFVRNCLNKSPLHCLLALILFSLKR